VSQSATICVIRIGDACLAIDVALVGEVVPLERITPLPRCPAQVVGLTELRGQPLAVVDLAQLLELPAPAQTQRQLLVLRTDVRLAGLPIDGCEGILAAAPGEFRHATRHAEPSWVAGFQGFKARPDLLATIIDSTDLLARLSRLRFQSPFTPIAA
jgi:purine-binding chemotaxis protein CheW